MTNGIFMPHTIDFYTAFYLTCITPYIFYNSNFYKCPCCACYTCGSYSSVWNWRLKQFDPKFIFVRQFSICFIVKNDGDLGHHSKAAINCIFVIGYIIIDRHAQSQEMSESPSKIIRLDSISG